MGLYVAILIPLIYHTVQDIINKLQRLIEANSELAGIIVTNLVIAFFIVGMSLMHYSSSINNIPYYPNIWGMLRFCLDLILVLMVYPLLVVSSINPTSFASLIFLTFIIYVCWDILRYKEYQAVDQELADKLYDRIWINVKYLLLVEIVMIAYGILDLYFVRGMLTMLLIMIQIFYRYEKLRKPLPRLKKTTHK